MKPRSVDIGIAQAHTLCAALDSLRFASVVVDSPLIEDCINLISGLYNEDEWGLYHVRVRGKFLVGTSVNGVYDAEPLLCDSRADGINTLYKEIESFSGLRGIDKEACISAMGQVSTMPEHDAIDGVRYDMSFCGGTISFWLYPSIDGYPSQEPI
jgi:hypothetical protein